LTPASSKLLKGRGAKRPGIYPGGSREKLSGVVHENRGGGDCIVTSWKNFWGKEKISRGGFLRSAEKEKKGTPTEKRKFYLPGYRGEISKHKLRGGGLNCLSGVCKGLGEIEVAQCCIVIAEPLSSDRRKNWEAPVRNWTHRGDESQNKGLETGPSVMKEGMGEERSLEERIAFRPKAGKDQPPVPDRRGGRDGSEHLPL